MATLNAILRTTLNKERIRMRRCFSVENGGTSEDWSSSSGLSWDKGTYNVFADCIAGNYSVEEMEGFFFLLQGNTEILYKVNFKHT